MSSVRASHRSRNVRLSSSASARPISVDSATTEKVSTTVLTTASRSRSSVKTLP